MILKSIRIKSTVKVWGLGERHQHLRLELTCLKDIWLCSLTSSCGILTPRILIRFCGFVPAKFLLHRHWCYYFTLRSKHLGLRSFVTLIASKKFVSNGRHWCQYSTLLSLMACISPFEYFFFINHTLFFNLFELIFELRSSKLFLWLSLAFGSFLLLSLCKFIEVILIDLFLCDPTHFGGCCISPLLIEIFCFRIEDKLFFIEGRRVKILKHACDDLHSLRIWKFWYIQTSKDKYFAQFFCLLLLIVAI